MQLKPSGIFLMHTLNSLLLKKIAGWFLIPVLMWGLLVSSESVAGADELSQTIQYLLDFVKNSQCRFYRNNKEHSAGEAAAHMQRKYTHFKNKIETPEDFIRLTATKSLMTGRLYYVVLTDGKKVTSAAWLLHVLEACRQKRN
jgi:hypothetical protein